jgi:hypothetical protein
MLRHPRNAIFVGLLFMSISAVYLFLSHDMGGATMLFMLGIAMGLGFYVLAAGAPRG